MDTPSTNGHAPRFDLLEARRQLHRSETRRLLERYSRWDDDWSCADLWRETRTGHYDVPGSQPSDRRGGANWPIWRTESDLDRIRQKARIVCETNPYAMGLLENLVTHIVGKGFKYKFLSKENTADSDPDKAGREAAVKALIAKAQDEWDRFQRRNRWSGMVGPHTPLGQTREQEILRRLLRDGEVLPRYYVRDGQAVIRFIEPEQLRNPLGAAYADGWSFGVKCDPRDVETVEMYHVVWVDPTLVSLVSNADHEGEEIDAADMDHLKGPRTDSTIRRGVSMFAFGVAAALERARVLGRNTSIAAAAKAAIAETWAHETGTESEVSTFRSGLADHTETRTQGDGTTTEDNIDVRYPGMIRDMPKGMTPVFPAPDNSAVYIQVLQADLRAACAAFAAPEYFTADATGGTYAGLKEASAPFVKFAESYQTYLGGAFARVAWRVLELAVSEGRLPREALTILDLQVEGPTVYQRDRLQVAQESQIYNMLGVWSPQTIAMETGKDYEIEAKNIEQHRERFGDTGTPLGMPGADGSMPGMPGMPELPGLTPGSGDDAGGALHEGVLEAKGTCGVGQNPGRDGCAAATDDPKAGKPKGKEEPVALDDKKGYTFTATKEPAAKSGRDDWVKQATANVPPEKLDAAKKEALGMHERQVKAALARGEKVSPDVLKDYPGLTKKDKSKKDKPGQSSGGNGLQAATGLLKSIGRGGGGNQSGGGGGSGGSPGGASGGGGGQDQLTPALMVQAKQVEDAAKQQFELLKQKAGERAQQVLGAAASLMAKFGPSAVPVGLARMVLATQGGGKA